MTRNTAVAFVVGVVAGAGMLLIGLAVAPGLVSADGGRNAPEQQAVAQKAGVLLDRLSRWLDRTETALTRSAEAVREAALLQKDLAERSAEMLDRVNGWMDQAEQEITSAGADAKHSALLSDLQTVRSQIELYKVQHDMCPGRVRNADGTFTDSSGETFVAQLTSPTDVNGNVSPEGGYGPYLQNFPENPFTKGNAGAVAIGEGPAPGDGSTGWYWDTRSLSFSPNDPEHSGE